MPNLSLLKFTLSANYLPASNLQGDAACADWRFLMPRLTMDRILIIGAPSIQTLAVLSRACREIFIVYEASDQVDTIRKESKSNKIQNITFKKLQRASEFPFRDSYFDLVQFVDRRYKLLNLKAVNREIRRILKPDAVVYFETSCIYKYLFGRSTFKALLDNKQFSEIGDYWLTPLSNNLRTAIPSDNTRISNYFFTNVLYGQSIKTKTLSVLGRVLSKTGLFEYLSPRYGIIIQHNATSTITSKLPDYLVELGQQSGLDINRLTFGFSARGKYNSNKVIFFVFDREEASPNYVIKITRTPEYNFRLENEFKALSLLKENKFLEPDTYPEPMFHGTHSKLAVLCIRAMQGRPFRAVTDGTAECAIAKRAMDLILRLGSESADKRVSSSTDVAIALKTLYTRFTEIYSLSREEQNFLTDKIGTLASHSGAFPLVFQHGDPGTWNMFVSENNDVILLDWESSEPKGMPLWDLFYFFRTYASWMSRKKGTRDSIKSFMNHFLERSALGDRLQDYTGRYCEHIGLERSLVEPLFYTCWMHRALKESTRLPASNLDSGSFITLLRLVIEQRKSTGLMRLFKN